FLAREPDALVLAGDTVVAVGRRILPKVEDETTLRECMKLLSGRRHRVMTGVALAIPGQPTRSRVIETMIAMKRLSDEEIEYYAGHGEWRGKAGGYALQGYGEVYVRHIAGSYSNVVGLPLAETRVLLKNAGYDIARMADRTRDRRDPRGAGRQWRDRRGADRARRRNAGRKRDRGPAGEQRDQRPQRDRRCRGWR